MFEPLIEYVLSWCTPFWLTLYVILGVLPIWVIIYLNRKLKGTKELNEKYSLFARLDYEHWSYFWWPLKNTLLLGPIRYAIAWMCVLTFTSFILLLMCGQPKGKRIPKWKENVLRICVKVPARIHMLMGGIISIKWVERHDICYKKYLG